MRMATPYEKPNYLSADLCRKYAKPSQWGVVAGFGAGGDVRGAIDAGMHLAIENNAAQYHATIANLRGLQGPVDDHHPAPSPGCQVHGEV